MSVLAKAFREREQLTQKELGEMLGYSAAAISALETGAQPASDEMLIKLEAVIGDGLGIFEVARELVQLDKFPAQFQDFAELEQRALIVSSYQPLVFDGLFQTVAYASALIGGSFPPHPEERESELVEGRLARKAIFDRDPMALIELVVDESVLTRRVGSNEVMRDQLMCLLSYARMRNVTVQVLPPNRGDRSDHVGLYGPLKLIETPSHEHFVYLEVHDEGLLISDPPKVSMYTQRYAKIRAQALCPDESLGLIERLAGEQT